MTTEEKLQHFFDASIQSASEEAEKIKKEHKEALDKLFMEHQASMERQAGAQLQAESDRLKRDINKEVSARQLEFRRQYSARTEEIKSLLFAEVEKKLQRFKDSPEYLDYLKNLIQEALSFAGEDTITVYIDPSDEALLPQLAEALGISPSISREAWGGGMRAVIRSKNILIDNSFATLLNEAREEYIFTGGMADE